MDLDRIKNTIFRLFKSPIIYELDDIFTPATAAIKNYVERSDIDNQLSSEMSTRGKQIIVFGDSGSGKTSSVLNLLKKNNYHFIRTHCESSTTFEELILNAFDQLNPFVKSETSNKQTATLTGEFALEYKKIKASIATGATTEENATYIRMLPVQLTPQKLAQFMGEGQIVWLIEDFHKVSAKEKARIADVLKIFVDNANDYRLSKIICIGACQSAHELIQLDPNLRTRVSEVSIPLLTNDEIKKIIINGFSFLNVEPPDSLVDKLVYYSDRLGASAHQMCMDICKKEKIFHTCRKKRRIEDQTFQYAVNEFIRRSEDTFKSIYEAAANNELGWYILKSFSRNNNKLSFDEILKSVNSESRNYDKEIIKENLNKLTGPNFNIIHYNPNTEMYFLSSPFWHHFLKLQHRIEEAENDRKIKDENNDNLKLNYNNYDVVDKSLYELIEKLEQERKIDLERLDYLTEEEDY